MTMTTSNKRDDSLLETRLQKARLALKDEERQFFPKTSSMLDHPNSQWVSASSKLYQLDQKA